MSDGVRILGADGLPLPLPRKPRVPMVRRHALQGGTGNYSGPAYDAADIYSQHMQTWQPFLWSPDAELNTYRDTIVSRVRDLVRNDGWASGAVTRILDNAIGPNLRPIPKPDYQFLQNHSGNKKFDHVWAKEYAKAVNASWRSWAEDDAGCFCDVTRNLDWGQMCFTAFRHKLVDGDALAVMHYLPDRVSYGRARYATAFQLVDPDRLSNPQMRFDSQSVRGGVIIDANDAAVGYYIRRAHFGDWFSAVEALHWDPIPRETAWGRARVVHNFDSDRAGQHRGGAGIFAPVLQRLRMLVKYDSTELDSAIINSIFGAYISSPFDRELVAEAVSDGESGAFAGYQGQRVDWHDESKIMLGNSRIPVLFPGEEIVAINATRGQGSNFSAFEDAFLRNAATCVGLSAQQLSNNWSNVNYSSARGALLEAWKTMERRRHTFTKGFCTPIRNAWLEEAMDPVDGDDLPMPAGTVPTFIECRGAYARCRWMGPGRGWIDPVAEKQGSVIGMDAALSTLEDECAAQGLDFEEVLEQRRYELELFDEYDIPRPAWAGQMVELGQPGGAQEGGVARSDKATPTPPKKQTPQKPQAV